jgi:protein arginine N-methyltransferase 5
MTTCPITTSNFYEKIRLELVSYYEKERMRDTEHSPPIPIIEPLRPEDSVLIPHKTIQQVIAVSSSWIDLASADYVIADISRQVFNLEIMYAAFCGSSQLLLPGPILPDGTVSSSGVAQFARALFEALSISPYLQFHILLPMVPIKTGGTGLLQTLPGNGTAHISSAATHMHPEDPESQDMWAAWEAWDMIRTICKYNSRISLALVVPKQAPPASIQARWFSEPVSMVVLQESSFVPNKYKQPVFHKSQQSMLFRMMRLRNPPWILLNDISTISQPHKSFSSRSTSESSSREPTPAEAGVINKQRHFQSVTSDPTPHLSYLRALQRKEQPRPPIEFFGAGYQDYLQMPLQPLADNLESVTYEVFEKDPIKYEWYERAIAYALHDWQDMNKPGSCPDRVNGRIVIAVCGSGRGPLVSRALAAADAAGADVDVWAVEKNPNAYVLLQRYNKEKWNGRVTVVKTDMRAWKGPVTAQGKHYKVDIIVSELLGSFGDNELSPECLDGVQHVLSKQGISIPSSYTAFLTPIATPRLHADIVNKMRGSTERLFELPYVVMLHQLDFLSYTKSTHQAMQDSSGNENPATDIEPAMALKTPIVLPCWTFDHPQPSAIMQQSAVRKGSSAAGGGGGPTGGDGANAHNTRFCRLEFPCQRRGVCHGFAGYFETVLYKSERQDQEDSEDDEWDEEDTKVELSTNPLTMERMSKDMISWFPIFFPVKVCFCNTITEP